MQWFSLRFSSPLPLSWWFCCRVLLGCLPCHCCRFPLAVAIFPHKLQHRGAKLEATDGDQYTPLLIAARWNRIDMVKVRAGLFWLGSSVLQGLCW